MLHATRRVLTTMALASTTAAASLLIATPASATTDECVKVVQGAGFEVGSKTQSACQNHAAGHGPISAPNPYCITGLENLGVPYGTAVDACRVA